MKNFLWRWGSVSMLLASIFLGTGYLETAHAAEGINAQIPFSGVLNDSTGAPLNGLYDMVFRIYNDATGNTILWEGQYTALNGNPVSADEGFFQVLLGSGNGNEITINFNDDSYYLGVTIGTDPEMTPRERIGATGYAFNTRFFDGYESTDFMKAELPLLLRGASSDPLLAVEQTGSGNLLSLKNSTTELFTVLENGNVGIGDTAPDVSLSVLGVARAVSFENTLDTPNIFAGYLDVQSGDTSYFSAGIAIGEGGSFAFGNSDGLSLHQDFFVFGYDTLAILPRGLSTGSNEVKIVTPHSFTLAANASENGSGATEPRLSLRDDGSAEIVNTSAGNPSNRILSLNFSNGVSVVDGDLRMQNGGISIESSSLENGLALMVNGPIQAPSLTANSGTMPLEVDTDGNFIVGAPSDARLKQNIRTIDNALDVLLELRGVRYEWKDTERFGSQTEVGFVAQELELVFPEMVHHGDEFYTITTKNLIAVVVEAVKELYEEVHVYFDRTEQLEERVRILEEEIRELKGVEHEDVGSSEASREEEVAMSTTEEVETPLPPSEPTESIIENMEEVEELPAAPATVEVTE